MPPKPVEIAAPSAALQRRLKALPALPLVILDDNPAWLALLKQGERSLPWVLLQMDPHGDWLERIQQHPQLRPGGWLWTPQPRPLPSLPKGWHALLQPWAWLGRWLLKGLPLKNRHVGLFAPAECALESLLSWLPRQGASLSWCDDNSRHLWNQLRLCDVAMVFPGFQHSLEAHQVTAGATLIDLRPDGAGLAGNALQTTLGAYCDASSGALQSLLLCLALAQQETLIELA